MILAQLSDTHLLPPNDPDPHQRARADALARCVADINALDPLPEAAIHTGDVAQHGDGAAYGLAREILSALVPPVYVVPGNRDDRENLRAALSPLSPLPPRAAFLSYVVEDHPVRLIGLDSLIPSRKTGGLCRQRLAWLDDALAAAPDAPTVLFMHHPPFYVDAEYPGAFAHVEDRDAFFDLIGRHNQVGRLICGHLHRPAEVMIGGVRASTMASVAVDLCQDKTRRDDAPVYQLHGISGQDCGHPPKSEKICWQRRAS